MKPLTIDRCIELLESAKKQIGGDKPVVLTNRGGTVFILGDSGQVPERENWEYHLSAHKPSTSFGFSTWTGGKSLPAQKLNLAQIEGKEVVLTELEQLEEEYKAGRRHWD